MKNFIDIDKFNLDEEWVEQPKLYSEYAEKLADAKHEVATCEAELELVDASIADDIRNRPEQYDIVKATKDAVDSMVILQRGHQKSLTKLNRAKHARDVLQAAVNALDHRKKALEDLVTLQGRDYFSQPKAPKDSDWSKKMEREKRKQSRGTAKRET